MSAITHSDHMQVPQSRKPSYFDVYTERPKYVPRKIREEKFKQQVLKNPHDKSSDNFTLSFHDNGSSNNSEELLQDNYVSSTGRPPFATNSSAARSESNLLPPRFQFRQSSLRGSLSLDRQQTHSSDDIDTLPKPKNHSNLGPGPRVRIIHSSRPLRAVSSSADLPSFNPDNVNSKSTQTAPSSPFTPDDSSYISATLSFSESPTDCSPTSTNDSANEKSFKSTAPSIDEIIRRNASKVKIKPSCLRQSNRLSREAFSEPAMSPHLPSYPVSPLNPKSYSNSQNDDDRQSRSSMDSLTDEINRSLALQNDNVDQSTRTSSPESFNDASSTISRSTHRSRNILDSQKSRHKASSSSQLTDTEIAKLLRSPRLTRIISLKRWPNQNINVSVADVGAQNGFPVVVFLGLGCVRYLVALYEEVAIAMGLRLVCLDRWGLGKTSDVPDDERGFLEWSRIVEEVVDTLGINGGFGVLAHSAGAPYALASCLTMSSRIRGSIHLLAPWASHNDVGSGAAYKWLKYVPSGVIKTAQHAEWLMQSWKLGKAPPTSQFELGIGSQSIEAQEAAQQEEREGNGDHRESLFSQLSEIDSIADLDSNYYPPSLRTIQTNRSSIESTATFSDFNRSRPLLSELSSPPRSNCDTSNSNSSKGFVGQIFMTPKRKKAAAMSKKLSRQNDESEAGPDSFETVSSDLASINTMSTYSRSLPAINKPDKQDLRRSISNSTSSSLRSPRTRVFSHSSTNPSIYSTSKQFLSPTTPKGTSSSQTDLVTALLRASHAESLKGSTADLLAILDRTNKPWGFSYADVPMPVKIWYGDKDEKVSLASVQWMEKTMVGCHLKIINGADHNLMTNTNVVFEALESIASEYSSSSQQHQQ